MPMTDESEPRRPEGGRRPYHTPVLRVFGSVTAITATVDMRGQLRDGGPTNTKT